MKKINIFLISCLAIVACNSGSSSSSNQVNPVNDLSLAISTPMLIWNSNKLNQVCLSADTPISKGSMININITSANINMAAVYPGSCTLINQVGGICCQFQITALAPGVVSISASSPGHQAVSQNLVILAESITSVRKD